MNIFKVIVAVISKPGEFFEKVGKGKDNLGFAFGYYALLSLFGVIIGFIFSAISKSFIYSIIPEFSSFNYSLSLLAESALSFFGYFLSLGLSFAFAGILHVWILLFAGKDSKNVKGYSKTYELGAYAGTPSMLFGWIPFVGIIWSLILLIIGTQKVHKFSKSKAIWMYVIPVGILVLFSILIALFAIFFFAQVFSALGPSALSQFGGLPN